MKPCPCGSGQPSSWQYDAQNIPLCRTCDRCHDIKMGRYRPNVLTESDYWADENIEGDNW